MPTDGDRAAEVLGDAIAEAVRRAVDDVGRAPLAEVGVGSGATSAGVDDVIDIRNAPAPALVHPDGRAADPYAVLGVARSAPWEQIDAARKRLARAWHPDAGGDEDLIRQLNAAYAELRIRRGR